MTTRLLVEINDDLGEFPPDFKDKMWTIVLDGSQVLDIGSGDDGTALAISAQGVVFKPIEAAGATPAAQPPPSPTIWDDLVNSRVNTLHTDVMNKVREITDIGQLAVNVEGIVKSVLGPAAIPSPTIISEIIVWASTPEGPTSPQFGAWLRIIAEQQLRSKLTQLLGDEEN